MSKLNIRKGAIGIVLLVVAYLVGSRALNTGSYWEYLGCFVVLYFAVKFIVRAVKKDGKKV